MKRAPYRSYPAPIARRAFLIGALAAALPQRAGASAADATALMQKAYDASRFENARFKARLDLVGAGGGERHRVLSGLTKLTEEGAASVRLLTFLGPADIKGVKTLTVERTTANDDLWIYLPSMRKARRLVSSNRRDPWVGSEFSLGDIAGHKVSEWTHALLRRETVDGEDCAVIESAPATKAIGAETGYSRRVSWIRERDFALAQCDFYDLSGAMLKSMRAKQLATYPSAPGKIQSLSIEIASATSKRASLLSFDSFDVDETVADSEIGPGALSL